MKLQNLPDEDIKNKNTDELQKILLEIVIKLKKLNKEMNEDPNVQKAQDMLIMTKIPFKKKRAIWHSAYEMIELELKGRGIKYNIKRDDIYDEE